MKLSLLTLPNIVANSAAAVQLASNRLLDLSTGSVLRAVLEANGSIALWMQWLIVRVLRTTRASSSSDEDLDSWMADFAFTRLPASSAVGFVTFSRYVALTTSWIAVGSLVKTTDGSQSFVVSADPGNIAWDPTTSRYRVNPGVTSLSVPITAQSPGSTGNVQASTISVIASPIPGVDTVVNATATTNGADGESDTSFRSRFIFYINSRSRSTTMAIQNAVAGVEQGLSYKVLENVDASGNPSLGNFLVLVDNGSGSASPALLAAINDAVERVRPIGSRFGIQSPVVTMVTISLHLTLATGANFGTISTALIQKITNYVNGLAIGAPFPITRAAQLAYDTDPSILNVDTLLLNGQSQDIMVGSTGVVKVASVMVT